MRSPSASSSVIYMGFLDSLMPKSVSVDVSLSAVSGVSKITVSTCYLERDVSGCLGGFQRKIVAFVGSLDLRLS
ncbi:hypothetical protein L2E82_24961 [Cichorium intybus]|uniref:Uncharacterized protein n=1 Tax=Cichorium intybus TaxID=13427 RepID=A0ACB9E1P6_CICIN|nr:hypothetical protein L2E82_24961 [Cichorium intybus]